MINHPFWTGFYDYFDEFDFDDGKADILVEEGDAGQAVDLGKTIENASDTVIDCVADRQCV